jgi:hypothetical protein
MNEYNGSSVARGVIISRTTRTTFIDRYFLPSYIGNTISCRIWLTTRIRVHHYHSEHLKWHAEQKHGMIVAGQGGTTNNTWLRHNRADDKWHGISRILAYSTSFGWNILRHWHGIESSISVEYSNIPLLSIPYVAVAGCSYGSKLTNPI